MKRSRLVLAAFAAAGALSAVSAEAGIVVRNDGSWVTGKIDKDAEGRGLWVRWPYGDNQVHGRFLIESKDVRWSDADADVPTDAYWKKFRGLPIDPPFIAPAPNAGPEGLNKDVKKLIEGDPTIKLGVKRVSVQQGGETFSLLKPWEWDVAPDGDYLMIVRRGSPHVRIHVFSVQRAVAAPSDQVGWMQDELSRLGPFETLKDESPRPVVGGFDYTATTKQTRNGETVVCLRRVFFREGRTWFFCAYAPENEWTKLAPMYEAALRSAVIAK